MFFGPDGEPMSIKWKIYKMIFRYTENTVHPATQSGFTTPQFPMLYDAEQRSARGQQFVLHGFNMRLDACAAFKLIGRDSF